jgi:uncharacterized protein
MKKFKPHPLIPGGVMQTIVGSQAKGDSELPEPIYREIRIQNNVSLTLFEYSNLGCVKGSILLAHGMGGYSGSGYMERIGTKLYRAGYRVFLINQRGSGPGMGMSDTLWNGGSSEDFAAITKFIVNLYPDSKLRVIGFSLSGNILLKYLGESRQIPQQVCNTLSFNPPADLRMASWLLSNESRNRVFNIYYMGLIRNQMKAIKEKFPSAVLPTKSYRTIWEFDEAYTAPINGYANVEEYYDLCSGNRFMKSIQIPTHVVCSKDDPFIPPEVFTDWPKSKAIEYIAPEKGGHMGYIEKSKNNSGDRRWMDEFVLNWAEECVK